MYSNPCLAECDGIKEPAEDQHECELGFCWNIPCTLEENPLCCYGKDYINSCHAEQDGVPEPAEDHCYQGTC